MTIAPRTDHRLSDWWQTTAPPVPRKDVKSITFRVGDEIVVAVPRAPDGRSLEDVTIYRRDASGRQMVAERQAAFERIHGTRSDALPSIGYVTWDMLSTLGRDLGLRWRAFFPRYGWRWALRPATR